MTAKEKNRGNTIPTAASLLIFLDFDKASMQIQLSTPDRPAAIIKYILDRSLTTKNAKTIPRSTECEMASLSMARFLSTKNTPSMEQAMEVTISMYRICIISLSPFLKISTYKPFR